MVRRLHVIGTQQAIIVWNSTLRNITFDTVDITNALAYADVEYAGSAAQLVLQALSARRTSAEELRAACIAEVAGGNRSRPAA